MTRPRILLVDDDPGIRRTLQIGLGKAGFDVIEARDGEEATQLWRKSGPDLLIVDIYMPRKSGLEVIKDLQAQKGSTPVIVMTDGGRSGNLNPLTYSQLLGPVRTIAKPFTLEQMVELVQQALGGR